MLAKNRNKKIIILALVFSFFSTTFFPVSGTVVEEKQRNPPFINSRISGAINNVGSLAEDKTIAYCLTIENNHVYVGGAVHQYGDWDVYVCMFDIGSGDPVLEWENTFDYDGDEVILEMSYNSGKIYVTGYTTYSGHRQITLKYDSATGSLDDQDVWGSPSNNAVGHAIEYYDGYVYTAGSQEYSEDNYRVIINKYSTNLDNMWSHYLDPFVDGPEYGYDLDIANGNAYITGVCHFTGHEWQLYPFLLKYDVNTESMDWSNDYGLVWWSQVFQSCLYDGSRVYVTGTDMGYQSSLSVYLSWVRESDGWMDGTVDRVWGGNNYDDVGDDIIKYSSNLFIAGLTESYGSGGADALLLKTDTSFNEIWYKTWGGSQDEEAFEACEYNGYIYTVGYTDSYNSGTRSAFLLRYSSDHGYLIWDHVWNGGNLQPNRPPDKPVITSGRVRGTIGVEYEYSAVCNDPDDDDLHYWWDWGDKTNSGWLGPHQSGEEMTASHVWTEIGGYVVKVKTKDTDGLESEWSDPIPVIMPKSRTRSNILLQNLLYLLINLKYF